MNDSRSRNGIRILCYLWLALPAVPATSAEPPLIEPILDGLGDPGLVLLIEETLARNPEILMPNTCATAEPRPNDASEPSDSNVNGFSFCPCSAATIFFAT